MVEKRQESEETYGIHERFHRPQTPGICVRSPEELELWLFVDADLAGDTDDTKSSSGGYLVIVGLGTWFPVTWIMHKQGATARSTTEAESISLATSLIQEAFPVWGLLELILGRPVVLRVNEDNEDTITIT